jgi:hypothetical protein
VATDVTSEAALGAVDADASEPASKRNRLYAARFLVVYLILALALVATGAGVVIATYGVSLKGSPKPWSSWKPSGSASAQTNAIAQRIGGDYVLPSGNQLLDVYPKKLTLPVSTTSGQAQIPIAAVAIRGQKGKIDAISPVSDTDSRIYQLCGTGTACAIGEGKASVARGQLVRREALEIALYTFKYVPGVTHVLAFMPPPPGSQPSTVEYFDKTDVKDLLGRPLRTTLSPKVPLPSTITPGEGAKIDNITLPHLFKYTLQQTQLGQAVLVLAPAA